MQKKFIVNLALLLFLNLLIKPFWILGIEPVIQERVGNEDYGLYFALYNFSFLLNIVLDFGITNFNNKNIAQNNNLLTKHFSSLFVLKLLLAVVYILATAIFGIFIDYDYRLMKLLLILGFNQFLISMVLYLRSNIAGLHLFVTDSFVSVLDRLIMIIICVFLVWGRFVDEKMDVMWFVYTQTAAYFLTALITFFIVVGHAKTLKFKFNKVFTLMILKKSIPFAILVLLMTFYNRIDAVMLERMLDDGAEQAGIYAKAFRLLDASNMIAYLFAGLLLPMFARMIKHNQKVDELVKLSYSILIVPAVIVVCCGWLFSTQIMEALYHFHIQESAIVFSYLMTCFLAVSTTYIFGTLLTANGNMKELNIMAASGMLLNITLNIILIPKYKAAGSAFASMITQFITAIIQVIIAKKVFHFKFNYKFIFTLTAFIIGVLFVGYLSTLLKTNWIIQICVFSGVSVLWAFTIQLINIKSIYNIIKFGE